MKRKFKAVLLSIALILFATSFSLIDLSAANPFSQSAYSGEKYGVNAKPPTVTILSPERGKVYTTRNITLNLNVSTRESKTTQGGFRMTTAIGMDKLSYVADWQQNTTLVFHSPDMEDRKNNVTSYYYMGQSYDNHDDLPENNYENLSLTLTNVPDGNHTVYVIAEGVGEDYYIFNWYIFHVTGIASTQFTVKTTPPKISLLPFEDKAYLTSEVTLNFIMDESTSQLLYALDGKDNVTINGNTTLTGLPNGYHNITIYAKDESGNVGASETLFFSIEIPDSLPIVCTAASIGAVAIAGPIMLIHIKKRKGRPSARALCYEVL